MTKARILVPLVVVAAAGGLVSFWVAHRSGDDGSTMAPSSGSAQEEPPVELIETRPSSPAEEGMGATRNAGPASETSEGGSGSDNAMHRIDQDAYEEAILAAEKALESDPSNIDCLLQLRAAYARGRRYSDAIKVSERNLKLIIDEQGGAGEGTCYVDIAYVALLELDGRQPEAIAFLEATLETYPEAKVGPTLSISARDLLTHLRQAQAKGLYSRYALSFKLELERDSLSPNDAIRLLERHLPIVPEGEEYIRMLRDGKSVRDVSGSFL